MTTVDDLLASGTVSPVTEVTATLNGQVLATVPITQGSATESASGPVIGNLRLTVPATDEWVPSRPDHPLAAMGQELIVRRGFRVGRGVVGWETLGTYRIRDTPAPSGGWLEIDADSVDIRLVRARWVVATRTQGSLHAQIRQICAGVVPVAISVTDMATADRSWEQQGTRRDALIEICDAHGAALRMVGGVLTVVPAPTSTTPIREVRGGAGGTLVSLTPITDGDPVPNAVIASSAPTGDTAPISAMAITQSGPRQWLGPYGPTPAFFASPMLTTWDECLRAAMTRLGRLAAVSPDLSVRAVTDPRTRLDSVVRVIDGGTTDCTIRVTSVTHALTAGREPGEIRGVILSGRVMGGVW